MSHKKLAVILILTIGITTPTAAQTMPAMDADHAASVLELLTLMDLETQNRLAVESMLAVTSEVPPHVSNAIEVFITTHLGWEVVRPELVQIYGSIFTSNEVRELIAFYESPAGA